MYPLGEGSLIADRFRLTRLLVLEGEDLARRLERRGRVDPRETVAIVHPIARALTKAHGAGIMRQETPALPAETGAPTSRTMPVTRCSTATSRATKHGRSRHARMLATRPTRWVLRI